MTFDKYIEAQDPTDMTAESNEDRVSMARMRAWAMTRVAGFVAQNFNDDDADGFVADLTLVFAKPDGTERLVAEVRRERALQEEEKRERRERNETNPAAPVQSSEYDKYDVIPD